MPSCTPRREKQKTMKAMNSPATHSPDRWRRNNGQRSKLIAHQFTTGALLSVPVRTSMGNQKTTVSHANISPSAENTAICRKPGNGVSARPIYPITVVTSVNTNAGNKRLSNCHESSADVSEAIRLQRKYV